MGSDNERKLYLQDPLLELRIPETEINFLTDLPGGLDYNEWLASHSKYIFSIELVHFSTFTMAFMAPNSQTRAFQRGSLCTCKLR